jgi:hypothetical protein
MCRIADLRYEVDREHERRAQFPNPMGTPQRHRIKRRRFKMNSHKGGHTMAKSVEGKNAVAEKAAPKEAAEKKPKEKPAPTMRGTKEVAKQLGVDPKFFRAVLRASGKGSDGQRYEWKIGDPLKAERKLIEDYRARQEERKANAEAKAEKEKAAKKKGAGKDKKVEKIAPKKGSKKAAAKEEETEEEDPPEEEEEVFEEE